MTQAKDAHILLAEDYPEFTERILALLEPLGATITAVPDGYEAVAYIEDLSNPLALVITDLTMPRRTGWHVIEATRRHRVDVPVIMQSGEAADRWVQKQASDLGVVLIDKMHIDAGLPPAVRDALNLTASAGGNRGDRSR